MATESMALNGGTFNLAYLNGLSRAQYQDIVLARAAADPAFKAALIKDPVATLWSAAAELCGRPITAEERSTLDGVKITILEETSSQKYVVIENGDLPDR